MAFNFFGGTLSLTQSINHFVINPEMGKLFNWLNLTSLHPYESLTNRIEHKINLLNNTKLFSY